MAVLFHLRALGVQIGIIRYSFFWISLFSVTIAFMILVIDGGVGSSLWAYYFFKIPK